MRSWILIALLICPVVATAADSLSNERQANSVSDVDYSFELTGRILVPGDAGEQAFDIESDGRFRFQQRHFSLDDVSGIRLFRLAETQTKVGDHTTTSRLPNSLKKLHFANSDGRLVAFHESRLLSREQVNLMQMPFDPLVLATTLPDSKLKEGDKWNLESWQLPILVGLETTVQQSATCTLVRLTDSTAEVRLVGKISGAVTGSASNINVSAEYRFNRKTGLISALKAQQKEKRTAGPVSPGLDVTANIRWIQKAVIGSEPELVNAEKRSIQLKNQQISVKSQSGVSVRLSRQWHVFHETPAVLMLRKIQQGRLISQCNLSPVQRTAPGSHTADVDFRRDVEASLRQRQGQIRKERTLSGFADWRIRHVNASGEAGDDTIVWDYYLCTAQNGKQFSLVFSRSESESKAFGDEAMTILKTLSL